MRTSSRFIFLKSCCDIDILAEILDWMACCIGLFDLLHELMRHLSTDLLIGSATGLEKQAWMLRAATKDLN